jgi:hypothetical protein
MLDVPERHEIRPFKPGESRHYPQFIRLLRGDRLAFMGFISGAEFIGDQVKIEASEPEALVLNERLPFEPPMVERGSMPGAHEFWWKVAGYVFDDLADPRLFPPLPTPPDDDALNIVLRYISTAEALAASSVVNSALGFTVQIRDLSEAASIESRLPAKDVEMGLALLVRHCDSQKEPARFDRVYNILMAAAETGADPWQRDRITQLRGWSKAVKRLRGKSLNQLMRDKLVTDRGYRHLDYQEEHSPQFLMSMFDYGDLLHWGEHRGVVAQWESDEIVGLEQRLAFLDAATGLAFMNIGFGLVAATAIGATGSLLEPRID